MRNGSNDLEIIKERLAEQKDRRPYFSKDPNPPDNSYVLWLDIMGSQGSMLQSTARATIYVMKLHVAALEAKQTSTDIDLYPVIDGIYVCSKNQKQLLTFINHVLYSLALTFILEEKNINKFMVRGCLAYGPVVKGSNNQQCSAVSSQNQDYCNTILIGIPLSQAYQGESNASPFGIYLHESVRAFAPGNSSVFKGFFLKWWNNQDKDLIDGLPLSLAEYYEWLENHIRHFDYPLERINEHKLLSQQYFSDGFWNNL